MSDVALTGLQEIDISLVRENPHALRTVNRESEEYHGLVSSMTQKGFLGAITVRQRSEPDGTVYYELIDGLHRFSAARDAGLETIKVDIQDLSDSEVLEAQIMANIHKIETKPIEYSKQLVRLLNQNPLLHQNELAEKLGKSPQWISQRLSLNQIDNPRVQELIDEGKITLANAYALVKLPAEELPDWVDRAMQEQPSEFIPQVNQRVKEVKEARRQGKKPKDAEFQPSAWLQKLRTIKDAIEGPEFARGLVEQYGISDPVEAALMALKWVLHLDPNSVEAQKAKDEERKREREEAKKKREAERAAKKAEEAATAAEEAKAALA